MALQSYTIRRAPWSSLAPITVEIEATATTPENVKLGLAVRVAIGRKADLSGAVLSGADLSGAVLRDAVLSGADLSGADLSRADLSGADLSGAVLRDAVLRDAVLSGAKIHGEPIARCFARIERDDGYTFLAMEMEAGGVKIAAGCRWFTVAGFRAHVAMNYPETLKATETLWIIDAIERRAADLGIALTTGGDQ